MFRCMTVSGLVIGSGSGCRGLVFEMRRWGRCSLWCCSYWCSAGSGCVWFRIGARSGSSWRRLWIHRFMIALMRGVRTPLRTTLVPVSAGIASNSAGYLPSRSWMGKRVRQPASCGSIAWLRAAWVTHAVVGCAVALRIRTRRVVCSITAGMYLRVPVSVTASKRSVARVASAWEGRNAVRLSEVCAGAGSAPAFFGIFQAVDAVTVMPRMGSSRCMRRYLYELFSRAGRSTSKRIDRTVGGRPTCFVALNGGPQFTFNEAVSFQVMCESQDEVDTYWSKLSEGGEEGPVGGGELDFLVVYLPLEDHDLVAQGGDFGVFGVVAHGQ